MESKMFYFFKVFIFLMFELAFQLDAERFFC